MNEQEQIFETKYNHYKKMVFNICYAYTRNHQDAEDTFQDVFMKFYDIKKRFTSSDHERNYLIRITINLCKDFLRKKKKQNTIISDELVHHTPSPELKGNNPLDMLEELNENYRDILVLKYIENMSNQDISNILNISESNVRKRLERAIKKLKIKWEETNL